MREDREWSRRGAISNQEEPIALAEARRHVGRHFGINRLVRAAITSGNSTRENEVELGAGKGRTEPQSTRAMARRARRQLGHRVSSWSVRLLSAGCWRRRRGGDGRVVEGVGCEGL